MAKFSRSVQIKEIFLKRLKQGKYPENSKLPTLRVLAKELKVSRDTLLKAFRMLEDENLIYRVQGSGVYVGQSGNSVRDISEELPEGSSLRHQEICQYLEQQIMNGELRTGSFLPQKKSLQYQFKTSGLSIRRAVAELQKKKLIYAKGGSFVIGLPGKARVSGENSCVYILGTRKQYQSLCMHRISVEYMKTFEQELNLSGVRRLQLLEMPDDFDRLTELIQAEETRGFLHLGVFERRSGDALKEQILKEVGALKRSSKPVVYFLWNSIARLIPGTQVTSKSNSFLYYVDDAEAGKTVGKYISIQGHRQIALFSFWYEGSNSWQMKRRLGVNSAIQSLCGNDCVIHNFDAGFKSQMIKSTLPEKIQQKMLKSFLGDLFGGFKFTHLDPDNKILNNLLVLAIEDYYRSYMEPFFEKALKNPEITAWVCLDNNVAGGAMVFLRKNKIDVPGRISLVGINNDEPTMSEQITICDFAKARAGYLSAHAILGDIPVKRNRNGTIDIPLNVVDRGSVRHL